MNKNKYKSLSPLEHQQLLLHEVDGQQRDDSMRCEPRKEGREADIEAVDSFISKSLGEAVNETFIWEISVFIRRHLLNFSFAVVKGHATSGCT